MSVLNFSISRLEIQQLRLQLLDFKENKKSSEQSVSRMTCCKQERQHWLQLSCHRKKKASVFLFGTYWTTETFSCIWDILIPFKNFKKKKEIFPIVTSSNTFQRSMYSLTKHWAGPMNSSTLKKIYLQRVSYMHPERKQYLDLGHPSLILFFVCRSYPSKTWPVKYFWMQTKWCADA